MPIFRIISEVRLPFILRKFESNLFFKDVFDGQGNYGFAGLFEKGLYLAHRIARVIE